MMNVLSHLQAPSSGAPPAALLSSWLVPMALIVIVYYFLLVAPARKQRKKMQEMLDNLKTGDRIITSGGIYGTIVRVTKGEDAIRLRVASSVEIDVARSAVTAVLPEAQTGSKP